MYYFLLKKLWPGYTNIHPPSPFLIRKNPDAGKDWRSEEKGITEDQMVGWHCQVGGHEFEQALEVSDGQGSLMCSNPWSRKELDMTERLNWNEPSPSVPTQFHTILLLTTQLLKVIENQLPLNPEVPTFLNDWHWGSSFSGLSKSSMLFPLLRHWWNSRLPCWSSSLESICWCRGRVQFLVQEASTWLRAVKPRHHNYWAANTKAHVP